MATGKSSAEDNILQKIFSLTLMESPVSYPRLVYLKSTAAKILSEGKELLLSRDLMERVLIDRLSGNFSAAEPPFQYLIGCYRRAYEESEIIQSMSDKNLRSEMEIVTKHAKKLSVSYCRIHLGNPGMFGNLDKASDGMNNEQKKRNVSPVLPLILAEVSSDSLEMFGGGSSSGDQSPPGFLEEFFNSDFDSLDAILKELYKDLSSMVLNVSVLGHFEPPLRALKYLVSLPIGAKSLVSHEFWVPQGANSNGRTMELASVLGPFFHISAVPDCGQFKSQPDVGEFFSETDDASLLPCYDTIINGMKILYSGLHDVLMILLKSTDTCENVLNFLAEVINANASRAHIQVDLLSCASTGMFVNLSAVMLRLLEAYLDQPDKIDPKYAFSGHHLKLSDVTALHASSKEVSEWIDKDGAGQENGNEIQSLSNEATQSLMFFMTARVLHLGLLKAHTECKDLLEKRETASARLNKLKALRDAMRRNEQMSPELDFDISQMEKNLQLWRRQRLCYEAQIWRDGDFTKRALSFYRLLFVWLIEIVGGFKIPLPSTCPKEFSCMPEHVVDDAVQLLVFFCRVAYDEVPVPADDFMNFIIMFMPSPEYVRNLNLRAKMVDVLHGWTLSDSAYSIFNGDQLSLGYLVRSLLKVYVDIEIMGCDLQPVRNRFTIRHNIAVVLEYLWDVPRHHNAWKLIAKEEEKGLYLSFLNVFLNDIISLLGESLKTNAGIKEIEAEMSNIAEGRQKTAKEEHVSLLENFVAYYLELAGRHVTMLALISKEITAPFLLPVMVERVANLLNQFLLHLVGPKRKSLSSRLLLIFCPKVWLKQIVNIYVNLARGDTENIFSGAISIDDSLDYEQLFNAGADEMRTIHKEDARIIQEFVELGKKAKAASDAELGEIPAEFLDPIQYTLMRDPVKLPTSKNTVDRPVIERHILNHNRDPFSQMPLTLDMLTPDIELKVKIDEFLKAHQSKKRTSGENSSNKDI